jgi:hypothetical protein
MSYGSGQLDPNSPRPQATETGDTANPTEQELELAKQVDKLFKKAAKHRKRYDKAWAENYKFYRGQQLGNRRASYKNREVINMIFRGIQGQTAVMMDTRPTVGFLPQDPSDLEFSEILNQVFEADWQKNDWMSELFSIMLDGHLYSVGIGACEWCENIEAGKAGIDWYSKDPFDIYVDPDATDINKKCEYIIDAKPWDLDKIKRKYAGHKYVTQIKSDMDDLSHDKRSVETLHVMRHTDLDLPVDRLTYGKGPDEDLKSKVLVQTVYMKPSDTEEIEQDDVNGGEKLYITKLKYPRGRKIVKINNFIFEDRELEYDDLKFPFQRFVNSALPREFYGIDELENLKGPQAVFNKMVNFSLDVLMLMGNPIWLNPIESGVNSRHLTSEPGLVVEHNINAAPQRVEGVQLQPWVFNLIDRMEKWFNDTAGDQDVTRGINPTGVTANAAIENLLDAAQKRVKQKVRNVDSMLRDFGEQYVSRVMQYYTAPQVFRLTNKEGANKYFKFHVEHREEPSDGSIPGLPAGTPKIKKVAVVRDYIKNDLGQMVPSDESNEYEIRGEMDVRVNTISGLPFSKQETEQRVLNLFDRQIIDREEVLKRFDYPNAELITQRMKQAQDEMAQSAPPPK